MKKIKKIGVVDYYIDWAYRVEISQIRKDLDELEKLGATNIDIQIDYGYDGDSDIKIEAKIIRLETDREFEIRNIEIEKIKQNKENNEFAQYKKLKLKFEK